MPTAVSSPGSIILCTSASFMDSPNLGALNRAIKAARDDGTLTRLAQKWLTPVLGGDPTKVPYLQVP